MAPLVIPHTGAGCVRSIRTGENSTHNGASIEHTAIAMIVGQSPSVSPSAPPISAPIGSFPKQ